MHWLMIAFLVSLCALLLAAGGVARHIWLHRAKLRKPDAPPSLRAREDGDLEPEP
jgi:hypothetical protein